MGDRVRKGNPGQGSGRREGNPFRFDRDGQGSGRRDSFRYDRDGQGSGCREGKRFRLDRDGQGSGRRESKRFRHDRDGQGSGRRESKVDLRSGRREGKGFDSVTGNLQKGASKEGTWLPVPGKLHPAIGVDEVKAKEKYGIFPARNTRALVNNDGTYSDVYFCDRAAYDTFNDAVRQNTELGSWVADRLRIGALLVRENYDQVDGWRTITLFGRPCRALGSRGKRAIPRWLQVHGVHNDPQCVETAQLFAEAAAECDVPVGSFLTVFVCGNSDFAELLRKDYPSLQSMFVEEGAVDKHRDVPFRLWHVASPSSSQLDEVCLFKLMEKYKFQGPCWKNLVNLPLRCK